MMTISELKFDILRNAIYHTARAQYLDRCTKLLNLIIIVLGTSAAAQLGSDALKVDPKWLSIGTAFFAAFQLVGDFAVSARVHAYLQRRCYELLSEVELIELRSNFDDSKIAEVKSKLDLIYGEEPPPMRALDAIAYNAACDTLGKSNSRVKISWLQSLLRHLYPFNGTEFVPRAAESAR